ncbi:MAG: pyridoxal-phosphate dependent enzyme [Anaerolineales bacterium]|nr:pyridoxal-phosphate dependent enzyme [Anaerolineales bacterium]
MNTLEYSSRLINLQLPVRTPIMARVGNTPLFRLIAVTSDIPDSVEIYVKAEWFNPSGSVKDRPAAAIIQKAIFDGNLCDGKTLLDATSGNMGIAYATFCAGLHIPAHLIIPANATPERLAILRSLGVELTLADPVEGTEGARKIAIDLAEAYPDKYFYADQYNNPENIHAHYQSTGPELLSQTENRITHFVAGLGTSGTMMGTGTYLKEFLPDVQLVAVQPDSPIHGLEGLKHYKSGNMPGLFNPGLIDRTIEVGTEDAYSIARRLAREEGLMVGVSAAAATEAALRLAHEIDHGVIIALHPDSALKYLNEPFWEQA